MRTQKSYAPYYYCVSFIDNDGLIHYLGHSETFTGIVEWALANLEQLPDWTELKMVNKRG